MRLLVFLVLLVGLGAFAGCPASNKDVGAYADDGAGGGSGSNGSPQACNVDNDCATAAATCCDCPAFAVNVHDPSHRACGGVSCPGQTSCPDNVRAACDNGFCALVCNQLVCAASCPAGYEIDANTGCLSCACAAVEPGGCMVDGDCVETRDDCCGCHRGGRDTAVLASQLGAYDASLGCGSSPYCPAVDACESGAAPHCIQGRCELAVSSGPPPMACGRDDLPACAPGYQCTVNDNPAASLLGVGVCVPQL